MSHNNKTILITGAAGYIGHYFLKSLRHHGWSGRIIGLDKNRPSQPVRGVRYIQCDILKSQWTTIIEKAEPDVLVHLAFSMNILRDARLMHEINVGGTKRTLEAAAKVGTQQILCSSSATAYGVFPDNPIPICEDHPIRIQNNFQYAADKGLLEQYYIQFVNRHPQCKLCIIRPVTVFGPNINNFISRIFANFPIALLIKGGRTPMQFVHVHDVAEIMMRLLTQEEEGAFNIAPDDYLTAAEVCKIINLPYISVPRWALSCLVNFLWVTRCRRIEAPAAILDCFEYPWVVNCDKMKTTLNYKLQYTSRQTIESVFSRLRQ